jgi:hypothetical protein
MESVSTAPVMPQLDLDAAGFSDPAKTSTETILDSTSLTDPVALETTKPVLPKKKRNAGERIQRR